MIKKSINEPYVSVKRYWTKGKLADFSVCERRYYYAYVRKEKTPTTGPQALGIYSHLRFKEFFDEREKYKTAEEFVQASIGRWNRIIHGKSIQGRQITLTREGEAYELTAALKKILTNFYSYYSERNSPELTEHDFRIYDANLNLGFNGKMDSLQNAAGDDLENKDAKILLTDYKTGKFLSESRDLDLELIIYRLASASIILKNTYKNKFGFSRDEVDKLRSINGLIESIEARIHNVRMNEIYTARINPSILNEFFIQVQQKNKQIDEIETREDYAKSPFDYPANWAACDACSFRDICHKETRNKEKLEYDLQYTTLFNLEEMERKRKNNRESYELAGQIKLIPQQDVP